VKKAGRYSALYLIASNITLLNENFIENENYLKISDLDFFKQKLVFDASNIDKHVWLFISICICTCFYIYIYLFIFIHKYVYVYEYVYIYIYICMYIYVFIFFLALIFQKSKFCNEAGSLIYVQDLIFSLNFACH
jgi:hypothetical protein